MSTDTDTASAAGSAALPEFGPVWQVLVRYGVPALGRREIQRLWPATGEIDCRTCASLAYGMPGTGTVRCTSPLRCVAGDRHRPRTGILQLWEARPVDAGF